MRYDIVAEGQIIPATLTLTRAGERLDAALVLAQGMFMANGVATRAEQ